MLFIGTPGEVERENKLLLNLLLKLLVWETFILLHCDRK